MDSKDNRGVILNRERKKQIISFENIRYGNITPTDLDGLIEYKNKAFIFMEFKLRDAKLPKGQRLALERMVDACEKSGKDSVAFVCEHEVDNPKQDIDASEAKVREMYWNGRRRKRNKEKISDVIQKFIEWVE